MRCRPPAPCRAVPPHSQACCPLCCGRCAGCPASRAHPEWCGSRSSTFGASIALGYRNTHVLASQPRPLRPPQSQGSVIVQHEKTCNAVPSRAWVSGSSVHAISTFVSTSVVDDGEAWRPTRHGLVRHGRVLPRGTWMHLAWMRRRPLTLRWPRLYSLFDEPSRYYPVPPSPSHASDVTPGARASSMPSCS